MDEDIITRVARTLATRELVCWQGEYSPSPEGYARVHAETVRVLSAPDGPLAPLVEQLAEVTRERDEAREELAEATQAYGTKLRRVHSAIESALMEIDNG